MLTGCVEHLFNPLHCTDLCLRISVYPLWTTSTSFYIKSDHLYLFIEVFSPFRIIVHLNVVVFTHAILLFVFPCHVFLLFHFCFASFFYANEMYLMHYFICSLSIHTCMLLYIHT